MPGKQNTQQNDTYYAVMTSVRNKRYSVSLSSVEVESSLNLAAMLSANAVRTSLPANDSHLVS